MSHSLSSSRLLAWALAGGLMVVACKDKPAAPAIKQTMAPAVADRAGVPSHGQPGGGPDPVPARGEGRSSAVAGLIP